MNVVFDEAKLNEMMRRAQQGDAESYTALLEHLVPTVRRLIGQRSQSRPDDVEDIVQEVLLSVHLARATYDPRRPFGPWLLAIVRNRVADAGRRSGRRAFEIGVEDLDSVTFSPPATNLVAEAYHARQALDRAVAELPPSQRAAFQLLKREGLSLKEAAAVSGMSVAALKVATHRAMMALRKILTR